MGGKKPPNWTAQLDRRVARALASPWIVNLAAVRLSLVS